jgi:hypothetical protein
MGLDLDLRAMNLGLKTSVLLWVVAGREESLRADSGKTARS